MTGTEGYLIQTAHDYDMELEEVKSIFKKYKKLLTINVMVFYQMLEDFIEERSK